MLPTPGQRANPPAGGDGDESENLAAGDGTGRRKPQAGEDGRGGNYREVEQTVADARTRFPLPAETPVVFCYEAGRDGFYPYRRLTAEGHEVWGNSQKIFPQILVVSLSIRDEHPGFAYDQTQDDHVTIDLHMPL